MVIRMPSEKNIRTPDLLRRLCCQSLLAVPLMLSAGCRPSSQAGRPVVRRLAAHRDFPLVISHRFGETLIRRPPQRVITLGTGAEDICLSLGVVPVAVASTFWGTDAKGYLPWFSDGIGTRPAPATFAVYPEIDIETIVRLRPDVILATQSGISRAQYRQLSGVYPLVLSPARAWHTPLAQQIDIIAAVLGRLKNAAALRQHFERQNRLIRSRLPEGKTFAVIYAHPDLPNIWCYTRGDQRADCLENIGLRLLPQIAALPVKEGSAAVDIGLENLDWLAGADLIVATFDSEDSRRRMERNPFFADLLRRSNRHYLPLTDPAVVMALTYGTPLSLDWVMPKILPDLTAILTGRTR